MRAFALLLAAMATDPRYIAETEKWRQDRESRLRAEDGWLSLAGLFWLNEGENKIGSAAGSRVELPSGFPADAGILVRTGNGVRFVPALAHATINGKPAAAGPLKTDKGGEPDIIGIGRLKLHVIERGTQLGVRMKDPESEARRGFTGLDWYPVKPEWAAKGRLIANPRTIVFEAQAGDSQPMESPGYVEWEFEGRKLRLTPVHDSGQLWFIFRDKTAGKTTYPAARFLYADLPKDGMVTVDFNRAYNPPCVFTPYATCPLPPAENRLDIAVEAGEKMYGKP